MSTLKYRPEIDGLRAIAVLSVVIFHLFPSYLPGGFAGVDIFFVISGYLITSIISRDINSATFSFIDFYARRARRIFPALITVLISTLVAGWFLLLPDEYAQLGWHSLGGATFTSNLILWSEVGYFDLSAIEKPLLHLWSLGVEEQFYLVWPLLLWAASRFSLSLFKVVVIIGTITFALSLYQVFSAPDAAFYSPLSRCWQLSAGAALALWSQDRFHTESLTSKSWYSFIGIALLIVAIFGFNEALIWPAPFAGIPVLGAMILLSASGDAVVKLVLSNRVFVFFGSISFALYLWHWPLLSLHQIVENSVHRDARFAILLVSILLAWLTTRFIEKPLRFKGRLRIRAAWVTSILVLVGVSGSSIKFNEGFSGRGDPVMETLLRDLSGGVTLPSNSTNWCDGLDVTFCSHQGKSPTAVLLGDSHARALYIGLRDFLAEKGDSLVITGIGGCAPFIKDPEGDPNFCVKAFGQAVDRVVHDDNVGTVFLTYRNDIYYEEGGKLKDVFSASSLGKFTTSDLNDRGLSHTIQTLLDAGKTVVFLWDVPNLGFTGRSCLPRTGKGEDWKPENCVISRKNADKQLKNFSEKLNQTLAKFPNVKQVHLYEGLCDSERCLGATDEHLLYTDDDHLSIFGSKYVIGALADKLSEVLVRASN